MKKTGGGSFRRAAACRVMAEQVAAASDPAAAQRAQDAFGCETVFLALAGADVTGSIACGRDIGSLQVTGRRP